MAVFGRRQPHGPIILRGLAGPLVPQKPVGRVLVFGQKASQASARRPKYKNVLLGLGPAPRVARLVVVSQARQAAENARMHPLVKYGITHTSVPPTFKPRWFIHV